MIEIDNVSFSYTKEKNTLEDIDLTIPQGELILHLRGKRLRENYDNKID